MSTRALIPIAAILASAAPVHAQLPGCWSLELSEWEWVAADSAALAPPYSPSESAARFVAELFVFVDSVAVGHDGDPVPPWKRLDVLTAAPEPQLGFWRDDRGAAGFRVLWSEGQEWFTARFPGDPDESESIVGHGAEGFDSGGIDHGPPRSHWSTSARLVRRPCDQGGVL